VSASPDRLDAVFQAAIAECRARTTRFISLPKEESFDVEYVTDKPWNAYNWYKGNYHSLIQVNHQPTDLHRRCSGIGVPRGIPGPPCH
jgi:NAD-dependent SIR2 family protein deacetylase